MVKSAAMGVVLSHAGSLNALPASAYTLTAEVGGFSCRCLWWGLVLPSLPASSLSLRLFLFGGVSLAC